VVHCWPGAALRTIAVAKRHGIPCLAERPNAHTEYAYQAAEEESRRCGIELPEHHDHAFDRRALEHEMKEYASCDFLLCPSEFVGRTFLERGTPESRILYHQYGFEGGRFTVTPPPAGTPSGDGITMLYAGVCEPRKGLHYALEAWLGSDLCHNGRFLICGSFVPGYREKLEAMMAHPSVTYLGHRSDLPEIMRGADVFVLSSVEEGSALVTYEARGSGCVLLVSDASGAKCTR
jgi:glycosyltransferase involved in cell wall biosynthesis